MCSKKQRVGCHYSLTTLTLHTCPHHLSSAGRAKRYISDTSLRKCTISATTRWLVCCRVALWQSGSAALIGKIIKEGYLSATGEIKSITLFCLSDIRPIIGLSKINGAPIGGKLASFEFQEILWVTVLSEWAHSWCGRASKLSSSLFFPWS